ncbi:MAG: ClbS/DfsB family four-helix bundle protein [Nanoarchaeales archaeon]|nr:ClbS/DfsB family four-helix bundle protein [Nanoarchaeales archaeon]
MVATTKKDLIDCISLNFEKIYLEFEKVSDDLILKKDLVGHLAGTKITVRDELCYLIGWGELVLKWYKIGSDGETVIMPEENFKWNNLGLLAEKFYLDYDNISYENLLKKFKLVVSKILKLVNSLSTEELFRVGYFSWNYEKWGFGRMIEINTSSPYKSNRSKIRKFLKENL